MSKDKSKLFQANTEISGRIKMDVKLQENETFLIETGNVLERLHCGKCGYRFMASKFIYCPICGRKVVKNEVNDNE